MGKVVFINNVVCINNVGFGVMNLTKGKVYDEIPCYEDGYICVLNDISEKEIYWYERFMSLEDYRDEILGDLLGEV